MKRGDCHQGEGRQDVAAQGRPVASRTAFRHAAHATSGRSAAPSLKSQPTFDKVAVLFHNLHRFFRPNVAVHCLLLTQSDRVERAIKRRMREVSHDKERARLQHSLGFMEALKYSVSA